MSKIKKAIEIIQALGRKIAAKKSKTPEGITRIQPQIYAESEAGSIAATLQNAGIPLDRLDDFIKSEADLVRILNQIEAFEKKNLADNIRRGIRNTETGKVFDLKGRQIKNTDNIMGGEELPPPGSRGGPDDIAAPVQSAEETIKNMIEAENKKGIASIRNRKMVKDAIDNMSMGFVKGDRKYNAQLVAEDLANKKFGKDFDDLDQRQQMDLYDEALKGLSEDFAQGGRAGFNDGGIDILKAEDEAFQRALEAFRYYQSMGGKKSFRDYLRQAGEKGEMFRAEGGRIGYKVGSIDKARRAFLKTLGSVGAGIGALKTGILSIGKSADAVKNIPPIKTPVTKLEGTTTEMPDWFPSFINKFRDEGKAENVFKREKVKVTKAEYDKAIAEGKGENYYRDDARTLEYKANNPDHMDYFKMQDTDERIYTTYTNDKVPGVRVDDMDGNVDVMFENDYYQPVSINYTAPGKKGPETGRADVFVQGGAKMETKQKGEFVANDVETYATDPDGGFDTEDIIADTLDDMMEGTTRQMEEYATGKPVKGISRGEGRVVEREIQAEQAADAAAEAAAEAAAKEADEFASGGIARMLGE